MNCPDPETLIAFAMNPLAAEDDELAAHVRGCADCRLNLRLVNDTLLAADWKSPDKSVDVAKALRLPSAKDVPRPQHDCPDRRIEDYIRVLDKDVKLPDGSWLRKGSKVLVDPHCPDRYEKATDFNVKRFVERGFSFFYNLLNKIETADVLANAQNGVNLPHSGRFALVSFLHTIGLNLEQILALFAQSPDFDESKSIYQIKHITGELNGSDGYTPPECGTMKTNGICYEPDNLCAKDTVNHPLTWFRIVNNKPKPQNRPQTS